MINQSKYMTWVLTYVSLLMSNFAFAAQSEMLSKNNRADEYIVVFKQDTADEQIQLLKDEIQQVNGQGNRPLKSFALFKGFSGKIPPGQLKKLEENAQVKSIETNNTFTLQSFDASSTGGSTNNGGWGLDRIDQQNLPLDGFYNPSGDGYNAHVYVLDTGISLTHNEFGGRADWVYTASDVTGGNEDQSGHGTMVAGVIGGYTYGVAKATNLHSVKVADSKGSGTVAGIIEGIEYVALNHQKPAVAVISASVPHSQTLNDAIDFAISKGVTVVNAAGDVERDACNYSPGSVSGGITVADTGQSDNISVAGNFGSCVDLYAPGLYIDSAWYANDSHNNSISHTPAAAAHVAGAAAIILDQDNSCTVSQVKAQIVAQSHSGLLANLDPGSPNVLLGLADEAVSCNNSVADYQHLVQIRQDQQVLIDFVTGTISINTASGVLVSDVGGYLYTPDAGFAGVDGFTYTDTNGQAHKVRIEVGLLANGGGNLAPGTAHTKSKVTALSNGQYILSYIQSQAVHYKRYDARHIAQTANKILYYTNRHHYDVIGVENGGYVTALANNASILVREFNAQDTMTRYEEIKSAYEPTLAYLTNGYQVIGYRSGQWYAKVYDANTSHIGTKMLFAGAAYTDVKLHPMQDGGFMAVGISGSQVMMQLYDSLGEPVGAILPVSTTATNVVSQEMRPVDVFEMDNGAFVAGWPSTAAQDGSQLSAMARVFAADGTPQSDEIVLNQYANSDQHWVKLARRASGGFVAVYQSQGADSDDGYAIMAREFSAVGQALSDGFRVLGEHEGNQHYPSVAQLTNGQLLVGLVDGATGADRATATVLALPSAGADILYGDAKNNILRGGGGDNTIHGNGGEDLIYDALNAYGGDGHDKFWRSINVVAGSGNDEVYITRDDNTIDGGDGFDVVYFTGASTDYTVLADFNGVFTLIDNRFGTPDGSNTLTDVEAAQFSDRRVLIDIDSYAPKQYPQDILLKVATSQAIAVAAVQSVVTSPANGVIDNGTGSFVYTPNNGYQGIDTFTYLDVSGSERTARIKVGLLANGSGNLAPGTAHTKSRVTALSNGQYILSYIQSQAVHYKRFDAAHNALTSNKILSYTNRYHYDMMGVDNGGYVTALANNSRILLRDFNNQDVQVRYEEIDDAYEPSLAYLQNGYQVLAYRSGQWYARIYQTDRDYVATKVLFAGLGFTDVKVQAMQDGGFIALGINGNDVMMQRYSHMGEPLGAIMPVSTTSTDVVSEQMHPVEVLEFASGDYVVSWPSTAGQDGSFNTAMARIFAADGTAKSNEIVVNQYADSDQHWVKLAPRAAGGFVAVYQSYGADGDGYALMAREFSASGQALSDEFRVWGEHVNNQQYPSVTQLTDGQLVVGLVDGSIGSDRATATVLTLPTSGSDIIYGDAQNNILRGGNGSDTIYGNDGDDRIYDAVHAHGGEGHDSFWRSLIVYAGSGNDDIYIGVGSNSVDGGSGFDVAYFSGAFADYSVSQNPNGAYVVSDLRVGSPDGTNYLNYVEIAQFTDKREVLNLGLTYTPVSLAYDKSASVAANQSVELLLVQSVLVAPSNGSLDYDSSTGGYVYTPNIDFVGVDTFTYIDANGAQQTMRIEVGLLAAGSGFTVPGYINTETQVTNLSDGGYILSFVESQAVHYYRYNARHQAQSAEKILYYTNRNHYDMLGVDNGGYLTALNNNELILVREFDSNDVQVRYEEIDNAYEPTLAYLNNGYRVMGYRSGQWYARIYQDDKDYFGTKMLFGGAAFTDVKVHAMQDGGFMALGLDGLDVMMQRYSHMGEPLGDIKPVSIIGTIRVSEDMHPIDVLELASGDYVVSWPSTAGQDGSGKAAMARVFAQDGTPKTAEIVLNQYTPNDQYGVKLAPNASSGFVAVYQSNGADGSGFGVMAREFSALGVVLSDEFSVWGNSAGNQYDPSVIQLPDGQLVVGFINDSIGYGKATVTTIALPTTAQ